MTTATPFDVNGPGPSLNSPWTDVVGRLGPTFHIRRRS